MKMIQTYSSPVTWAAALLLLSAAPVSAQFSVRDFGATGDGTTLDTGAVNAAITAAAEAGGGVVEFPAGDYLCHSIRLKSHVSLHLGPGSTIIAADPPPAGEPGGYDAPGHNPSNEYLDFGHAHWPNSLIWGVDLEYVSITGPGLIYGRGLSRGIGRKSLGVNEVAPRAPGQPPHGVMQVDGPSEPLGDPNLKPGPFGYPNPRDTLPAGVGNKAIALKNCRNVTLRDFSILHGGHFAILATGVDNLTIDNLLLDTNRDGIDVDACSNVRISNTSVNSPWDDGICLKSTHALGVARVTENVTITNCFLSGYDEGTLLDGTRTRKIERHGGPMGRIKFGTEAGGGFRNITISNCVFDYSRGIALEQVDGGVLEDVAITNITMRDVPNAPIFIIVGARLRRPGATEPGVAQRILIDNVTAWNVTGEQGILITGLPGYPVKDVVLSNLQMHFAGGGTEEQAARVVPEREKGYPEPGYFGILPSWGIFARHAENLQVRGIEFRLMSEDARPAAYMEDVKGLRVNDVLFSGPGVEAIPQWNLKDVSGVQASNSSLR